jgi:hypothetical protein
VDVKEIRQPMPTGAARPFRAQSHASRMADGDNTPRPAGASQHRHIARL